MSKKIILVGGTFADDGGKSSRIIGAMGDVLLRLRKEDSIDIVNGGTFGRLKEIYEEWLSEKSYDTVFWFANVDNGKEKIRNVKEILPKCMLVTSKRNVDGKYAFLDLEQRALASKSNLMLEFAVDSVSGKITFNVLDPLGDLWYTGDSAEKAMERMLERLDQLSAFTRQGTIRSEIDVKEPFNWYYGSVEAAKKYSLVDAPDANAFLDIVHRYADVFHKIMFPETSDVKRFLGNCSQRLPKEFRCPKGMPSFRGKDYIFVSRRNVNKEEIGIEHFVPVYMEDGKLFYCGDHKPSVDAPVQVRLYQSFPNINYMIHSHCYVKDAPVTSLPIPCGALEETDEILRLVNRKCGGTEGTRYAINLLGHGSLIMGCTVKDLEGVDYIARELPEKQEVRS